MKNLLLSLLSLTFLACSSGPQSKITTDKIDPNAELNSRIFSKDLTSIELKNASSRSCPSRLPKDLPTWTKATKLINSCLKVNKTRMAEKLTQKLMAAAPQSPWASYYLSVIYEKKRNLKKAKWLIDLSLRKANKIGLLYYQKARLEWKLGNKAESFDALVTASNLDSDLVGAHIQLSQIYHLRGDAKSAKKHYVQAKSLEPSVENLRVFANYKPSVDAKTARNPAKTKGVK